MHPGRLTGAVLLLGACWLLAAGRLPGQFAASPAAPAHNEVIAIAVPVTPQAATPPAPQPPAAAPGSGAIQQVSFVPPDNPPAPVAPAAPKDIPPGRPATPAVTPSAAASAPAPANPSAAAASPAMLPPSALLSGIRTNAPAGAPSAAVPETPAAAVAVEVRGPDQILLGKPLVQEIVLRNTGGRPVAELHLEEPLPAGTRILKAQPPALLRDNRLSWDLRNLPAGGERRLKVELNPGTAGVLDLRPYVTFLGGDGLRTKVTRPPFSVEMTADHDKVSRGEHIRFTIRAANHGDAPVYNVHLYDDELPPGLHHPQGPKIGAGLGDLLPGETRTITLETTAVQSGTFRNEVRAVGDRGVEARAAVDVVITEPALSLRLDGPAKTATQQEVDFHLEVANPGSLPAKNVRLVQALPPTFAVVWASPEASLDRQQHTLVWSLPDLAGGQRQAVTFRIKASLAGDWPLTAAVMTQNFPEARAAHTLRAEAAAALRLEVQAREERLAIGAETFLQLHLFNKGDAPCTGLRLTAMLPDAVTPLEAQGPSAGQVDKQKVVFAPLAQLDAHTDVVYRIRLRGRQVGQGAVHVELAAEKQTTVQNDLSLQVHGAAATTAGTAVPPGPKPGGTPVPPEQKSSGTPAILQTTGATPLPGDVPTRPQNTKSASGETLR